MKVARATRYRCRPSQKGKWSPLIRRDVVINGAIRTVIMSEESWRLSDQRVTSLDKK